MGQKKPIDVVGSPDVGQKLRNNSREEFHDTVLPDRYLCEDSPDKLMLEALKELNINDLKDILQENEPPDKQFHLESSRGDVKDRLTAYQLQSYFGGRKMKDFCLLSKLGDGLSVVDNDDEIPTIGELVNRKRGKRR